MKNQRFGSFLVGLLLLAAPFLSAKKVVSGLEPLPKKAALATEKPSCLLSLVASATNATITCTNPSSVLSATASNGTSPYAYAWSNGQTGSSVTVTACGSFTVTATDAVNCTTTKTVTITCNNAPPAAAANSSGTITCAQATAALSGAGSATGASISYLWTGACFQGATNAISATACAGGAYSLRVTNAANGCSATATTIVASNNAAPSATIAAPGQVGCSSSTMTLNASGSSFGSGFSINWAATGGGTIVSGATTLMPTVTPGGFTLTVTDLTNGCSSTATASVTQNIAPPTANAGPNAAINCATPTAILSGAGSSAGADFSYQWTATGGGQIVSGATTLMPTVNMGGTYTLVVTNAQNGCTASDFALVSADFLAPTADAWNDGPLTCTTTTAMISASSSAANSSFSWTGPAAFASSNQQNTVNAAGAYTVTVTDLSNGCKATATTALGQNTTMPTAAAAVAGPLDCAHPTVQISGAGSSTGAGFSYLWTTTNGTIVSGATTLTLTVSAAGAYLIKVTNAANGCTATTTATVGQTPAVGAVLFSMQNVACFGGSSGSSTVAGSGGTGVYSFLWSNGQSSATATGLAVGTYSATVTDANSCSATTTATIAQPPVLTANATSTAVTGNGQTNGTATAAPTGGTPAYQFLWSNGSNSATISGLAPGSYSVTATDSKSCTAAQTVAVLPFNCAVSAQVSSQNASCFGSANGSATVSASGGTGNFSFLWSNGATTQTISGLAAGAFSVTATDGAGCPVSASATISQPAILAANASATAVTGNGQTNGTATAAPTGGTPAYQLLWSNGATSATISGLAPSSFSVTATDSKSCSAVQTVSVLPFNCTVAGGVSSQNVSCFGAANGSATVNLTGGTAPFSFAWSNGATTQTISGLAPGAFSATATDANGCPVSGSATVSQPSLLTVNASATPQTSNGSNSGTASAAPSGGSGGFQFLWSNGAATAMISGLAPGAYTVSVTDASGCSQAQTVTVNTFSCAVSATVSIQNVACFGQNTGSATVFLSGAAQPLSYVWSNGQTAQTAVNLGAGAFSVSILDAANCPATATATIAQPPLLTVNATATQPTMIGQNTGTATATAAGGSPNYQFLWSNGAATAAITGLAPGIYSVTTTDAKGCTASVSVTVNAVGCALALQFAAIVDATCFGLADGSATVATVGGTAAFSFAWSNGQTAPKATGLAAGNYFVTVADAQGCAASGAASVSEPPLLQAALQSQQNVVCPEATDGSATVGAMGGTAPFSFAWSNGETAPKATSLVVGPFSATVTDQKGCSATVAGVIVGDDNVSPMLVCPSDFTGCSGAAVVFPLPMASDNCSNLGFPKLVSGLPSGDFYPVGMTTNLFSVTDLSGNTATCSFAVTVFAPLEMSVDVIGNEYDGASNGSILISIFGGQPPFQFVWTLDGQPFSATSEDLTGLAAGVYQLEATDAGGCSRLFPAVAVQAIVATENASEKGSIRAVPNPSDGLFDLKIEGATAQSARLFDSKGQLLQVFGAEELGRTIDLGAWPAGLFALVVEFKNGERAVVRLVRMR